jgi:hypothetical protein
LLRFASTHIHRPYPRRSDGPADNLHKSSPFERKKPPLKNTKTASMDLSSINAVVVSIDVVMPLGYLQM